MKPSLPLNAIAHLNAHLEENRNAEEETLTIAAGLLERGLPPIPPRFDQQKWLSLASRELLIKAAEVKDEQPINGGEINPKLAPERLLQKVIVYVRQSKPRQLIHNQESTRLQFSLRDRARTLGFQRIVVVDDDLGERIRVWSIVRASNVGRRSM
jgi:hypothetical protein